MAADAMQAMTWSCEPAEAPRPEKAMLKQDGLGEGGIKDRETT